MYETSGPRGTVQSTPLVSSQAVYNALLPPLRHPLKLASLRLLRLSMQAGLDGITPHHRKTFQLLPLQLELTKA